MSRYHVWLSCMAVDGMWEMMMWDDGGWVWDGWQKHNGIHFSIWACHPSRRGHANLLCIVPILTDVPEGTNSHASFSLIYSSKSDYFSYVSWFSYKSYKIFRSQEHKISRNANWKHTLKLVCFIFFYYYLTPILMCLSLCYKYVLFCHHLFLSNYFYCIFCHHILH